MKGTNRYGDLLLAAKHGTLRELNQESGPVDPALFLKVQDENHRTVLHTAAMYGHLDQAVALYGQKRRPATDRLLESRSEGGWTVFHWAAFKGQLDQVPGLLNADDPLTVEKLLHARDNRGRTVFHMAAMNGGLEKLGPILPGGDHLSYERFREGEEGFNVIEADKVFYGPAGDGETLKGFSRLGMFTSSEALKSWRSGMSGEIEKRFRAREDLQKLYAREAARLQRHNRKAAAGRKIFPRNRGGR